MPRCWRRRAPALPLFLDACSKSETSSSPASPSLKIASPQSPVTWDIPADNTPIADGLAPEQGATLQLYSYADYISPDAVKSFEEKYKTTVQVSTFNDTDEAITKIRGGNVDYDIYFPSYDQISRLVNGGLLKPLNHSYIPGISNVWPTFTNPWYDQEWRFTVPYTVYTTGLGWRNDQVPEDIGALSNPYDSLWDPKYKNKTAVIDDWHTAMALPLLRAGQDRRQHVEPRRSEDDRRADDRDGGRDVAEGDHHHVQRHAGRPDRAVPDVVG